MPAAVIATVLTMATLAGAGCSGGAMPGQMLGTYKVVGQSQTNTCGLGAPNPWTFDVQLSVQQSTLYWDWLDGSPLLSGTLSGSSASIADSATVNADSTDAGLGPCNLQTSATLQLALGSGSPAGSFTGTMSYAYTPASGATCTDVLAASGGMYNQLPCTVTYDVTATRQ
jgi:hypothetical protein